VAIGPNALRLTEALFGFLEEGGVDPATGAWAVDLLVLYVTAIVAEHSGHVNSVAPQEWTAQQIRNSTSETTPPRFLIRDRDDKFGATFDRAARGAGIRVIKSAVSEPNMNPVAERFVGSLRRELLDHVLLLDERHLDRVSQSTQPTSTPRALTRLSASAPLTARSPPSVGRDRRTSCPQRPPSRLSQGRVITPVQDGWPR
jgi:putative transposase